MAGPSRRENVALSAQLLDEAEAPSFEFFQAVRLLEAIVREAARHDPAAARATVGQDRLPQDEVVRFRTIPSLKFSAGDVCEIRAIETDPDRRQPRPFAEMTVSFMGLFGPSGALPQHYTSLIIERGQAKDFSLRNFLDIFNHRLISFFYRAWEKYRLPYAYERFRLNPVPGHVDLLGRRDLFTFCLYCLIGLGTEGLTDRADFSDEAVVYYGGHFAHRPRSANALECLLEDYLRLHVEIEQYCGRWLYLDEEIRSALPGPAHPEGLNHELGRTVTIGKRVWDVQGKFRVKLGPLPYAKFLEYMPNGRSLRPACQLVRLYAGVEYTFDVQPVLKAAEVPRCQIGRSTRPGSHLGWNTWLKSREFPRDADDAIFRELKA